MKTYIFILGFLSSLLACQPPKEHQTTPSSSHTDYTLFVDPMIGTKNMGHVYPGATAPFGMVQLSPETNSQEMYIDGQYNRKTYEYCAGYQYNDSTIFGFSHTHFSGTGHSDLGDFRVMPTTGNLKLEPGIANEPGSGYHLSLIHIFGYGQSQSKRNPIGLCNRIL